MVKKRLRRTIQKVGSQRDRNKNRGVRSDRTGYNECAFSCERQFIRKEFLKEQRRCKIAPIIARMDGRKGGSFRFRMVCRGDAKMIGGICLLLMGRRERSSILAGTRRPSSTFISSFKIDRRTKPFKNTNETINISRHCHKISANFEHDRTFSLRRPRDSVVDQKEEEKKIATIDQN